MPDWWRSENMIEHWNARLRIIFFNPAEVYRNLGDRLDPYRRHQVGLNSSMLFPDRPDGLCPCGCGKEIRRRWASDECASFAIKVYFIIAYGTQQAKKYLTTYYGDKCARCDEAFREIDHIIPVKFGGGGCWLSNYMLLCSACHTDKTNQDFKRGEYKSIRQRTIFDHE